MCIYVKTTLHSLALFSPVNTFTTTIRICSCTDAAVAPTNQQQVQFSKRLKSSFHFLSSAAWRTAAALSCASCSSAAALL